MLIELSVGPRTPHIGSRSICWSNELSDTFALEPNSAIRNRLAFVGQRLRMTSAGAAVRHLRLRTLVHQMPLCAREARCLDVASWEVNVSDHKYKVGQLVNYLARERASGVYQVTQLMPLEGEAFQYRIKNANEPHERVAKESKLRAA